MYVFVLVLQLYTVVVLFLFFFTYNVGFCYLHVLVTIKILLYHSNIVSITYIQVIVVGETTLGFFTISNSSRQYLDNELDAVSDPVYIPYGFPFGNETHTKAYVSNIHIVYTSLRKN